MEFKDHSAIVTGAGQGIGYAIAEALCRQGASVLLNDVDETLCRAAADRIGQAGGRCVAFAGDASDVAFTRQLTQTAVDQFGGVDLLVANAGLTLFGDFFDYDPAHFERVLNLNLRGSFFLTQAVARQMRAQGRGGSVLLMSSVVGHQAHPGLAAYAMTKAALEMLARNLVLDLSPHGITINALAPGATETERTLDDPTYVPIWSRITPMGRPATVADQTHAALFLLHPTSRHITGQSLVVDGGWTSVSPPPVE